MERSRNLQEEEHSMGVNTIDCETAQKEWEAQSEAAGAGQAPKRKPAGEGSKRKAPAREEASRLASAGPEEPSPLASPGPVKGRFSSKQVGKREAAAQRDER